MSKIMKSSLTVENDMAFLPVVTAFAESAASIYHKDKDILNKVLLSSEEAFCYTAENAYEQGERGTIIIDAECEPTGLRLSFTDYGLPFDISVLNSYNPRNPDETLDGLGLFLIQKTADEVKWEHKGAGGNAMTIMFHSKSIDISEMNPPETDLPVQISDITENNYDIRFALPSDAVHISRCMYRTYGYSYPSEWMYYPDKLGKKIEEKSLISIISVCGNGEVAGHLSLDMKVQNILAESGQAVVDPRHRSHNLLEKMKLLLIEKAVEIGLKGICSEPVTNHTRSQQTSLKTGNFSCGLMLGYMPATVNFKKMDKHAQELRRSCVYNYMPLCDSGNHTVYVPEEYNELIQKIYSGCGIAADIKTEQLTPHAESTDINSVIVPSMSFAVITVKKAGKDYAEQLKQGLFHLTMRMSADMVYLNLPIEDESCAYMISKARELGFVFCTVAMALDDGRDMLRMQFINCDVDYEGIQLVGDTAQYIFSFIKKELSA